MYVCIEIASSDTAKPGETLALRPAGAADIRARVAAPARLPPFVSADTGFVFPVFAIFPLQTRRLTQGRR